MASNQLELASPSHINEDEETQLELSLPASNLSKKDKEEAYKYVCALLNSNGGTLILKTKAKYDNIIRPIEQNIKKSIGSGIVWKLDCKFLKDEEGFILKVKGLKELCTLNYNIYLPSNTQKIPVEPHEAEQMKDLLNERRIVDVTEVQDSPQLSFVYDQPIGTQESKTVQFKHIQSEKNLAESLYANSLVNYISAFANYYGGELFCGVDNNGIVKGQDLKDNHREAFRTKISDYINKMIWPEYIDKPVQGPDGQYDISFEPVILHDGTPMTPARFVVIIKVQMCLGGVFCGKPESYHVVNGEVRRMEFSEWKRRLIYSNRSRPLEIVSNVPLLEWDSVGRRRECDSLDGRMLRIINNGQWDKFNMYADKSGTDLEKQLVVLSKRSMYCYRKNMFDEAVEYLEQLSDQSANANNVMIFDVRQKLVLSALERSRGDHVKSYQIAEELLPKVKQLAPSILTAEFYVHFATMLTIFHGNDDFKKKLGTHVEPEYFKEQALKYYDRSLQHLENVSYVPVVDMQQKAYINMAILLLGCSLSGDIVNEKVTKEHIEEAGTCLNRASQLEIQSGVAMTGFRSCHNYFARAFLSYRRAQHELSEDMRIERLEDAIRLAEDTEMLAAKKYDFKELSAYARTHAELFKRELSKTLGRC